MQLPYGGRGALGVISCRFVSGRPNVGLRSTPLEGNTHSLRAEFLKNQRYGVAKVVCREVCLKGIKPNQARRSTLGRDARSDEVYRDPLEPATRTCAGAP